MKEKKKKKGGQRAGAGRKPSGRQKEAVTVYTDVSKFGGKEGARMAIYEFLDGKINFTGKSSFVPLDIPPSIQKKFPPSDQEVKPNKIKAIKSYGTIIGDVTKPMGILKPKENPMAFTNEVIQKEIEAIKAEKCPKERDTPMGRRSWAVDQHKRIQELQNKLNGV